MPSRLSSFIPDPGHAGGIYRQLVQRQLQSGFSSEALPTIVENGNGDHAASDDDDIEAADDAVRSDTDDETVYTH